MRSNQPDCSELKTDATTEVDIEERSNGSSFALGACTMPDEATAEEDASPAIAEKDGFSGNTD
jgi:hypothetical protein